MDYTTPDSPRPVDHDLRRRLLARIGAPLTASAAPSDNENAARTAFHSLISEVYETARG
jgi:hypothetical protein